MGIKYKSKIREKTFIVWAEHLDKIHVYIGEFDKESVSNTCIQLSTPIKTEKEFHVEISEWMFINPS